MHERHDGASRLGYAVHCVATQLQYPANRAADGGDIGVRPFPGIGPMPGDADMKNQRRGRRSVGPLRRRRILARGRAVRFYAVDDHSAMF